MSEILLAEDNPGDVYLVEKALEAHGIDHHLHVVKDGGEALEFVAHVGEVGQAPCPDLILLDINLPKADGFEVLRELRRNDHCVHTPVIIVSSSDARKDHERMDELGVAGYFRKPFTFDEFMELGTMVRQMISHQ